MANALWDDLIALLLPLLILSPADGPTLTSLCLAYSLLQKSTELVQKEGIILTNRMSGISKPHPAVNIASGAARDVRTFASELGLSPTARARILHLQEQDKTESMDDFLDDDGD